MRGGYVFMKQLLKMEKQMLKYFKSHPRYNSFVHAIIGMGVGVMITYPLVGVHPVKWGAVLLGIGILAHLLPLFSE